MLVLFTGNNLCLLYNRPVLVFKTSGLMAERLALTEWFVSVFACRVIVMLISRMKCSNDNDKNQTK